MKRRRKIMKLGKNRRKEKAKAGKIKVVKSVKEDVTHAFIFIV